MIEYVFSDIDGTEYYRCRSEREEFTRTTVDGERIHEGTSIRRCVLVDGHGGSHVHGSADGWLLTDDVIGDRWQTAKAG